MKNHRGIWLPDGETHFPAWMDKVNRIVDGLPTYQYHKLEAALAHVKTFGVAIDVGAHCGLWAMHLAKRFDVVVCFEPVAEHVDCLRTNTAGAGNVRVHEGALGNARGLAHLRRVDGNTGNTHIADDGDEVDVWRYDDLLIQGPVSFVKIDVEGYELFVVEGMREMLTRDHPVMVVEQKPGRHDSGAWKYGHTETAAVDLLVSLGAQVRQVIAGDYILSW